MKAFPTLADNGHSETQDGMDLRDYFAARATEEDIQEYMWEVFKETTHTLSKIKVRNREESKYAYADAMIKARDK